MAHVREERRARPCRPLGEIAGVSHHGLGALGGFFAHGESRRHLEMIDERHVRASRDEHHHQREQGYHDRCCEVMGLVAGGERHKDRKGDGGDEAANAERVGGQRGERARDDAGEHDEDQRRRFERDDRQDEGAANAPRNRQQRDRRAYAVAHRAVAQLPSRCDHQPGAAYDGAERDGRDPPPQHVVRRVRPGERGDDHDENRMGEDAEAALVQEPFLEQPCQIGANPRVGRDGGFGSCVGSHGPVQDRHGVLQ